jgi:hypothetical protein
MDLTELYTYVVKETGHQDLWYRGRDILNEQEALIKIVDEPSGFMRAETDLQLRETQFEKESLEAKSMRDAQLRVIDTRGEAEIAESDLESRRARSKLTDPELIRIGEETDYLKDQFNRAVHRDIMASNRTLAQALDNPLKKYRLAKVLRRLLPKVVFLLIVFVTFELGGTVIEETIGDFTIKIGVVIALWGLQQFVFDPMLQRRLLEYERRKLKDSIRHLYFIRLWAAATKVLVAVSLKTEPTTRRVSP